MNLVHIQVTPLVNDVLKDALSYSTPNSNDHKQIENALNIISAKEKQPVYIAGDIVYLAYRIKTEHDDSNDRKYYFHELLNGCDLFVPEYIAPERNKELDERIEKLKAEQSNLEYREMTKNVDLTFTAQQYHKQNSILPEMRSIKGQLITIFNVFLTIGGAFAFGYYSIGHTQQITRIFFGLFCAFIVAIADFYFLFKRLSQLD
ncbi:unnamed protein product [Didymodactylos carnosus]|uniref:Uncharacterized protein n=1 Tax=Didymodactylos carnosus TaxID=1234261 RepID=A0A813PBR8_9BILA|nr:unnamed protein product [Didymodactylos carnosus]CAF0748220.1 unnamed protein product [Didymodactylos carnosus]CAF3506836.1 unnamed protein product [Didymodactylos carnosus]CAF3527342.1 unnamed protein product [Didymodactylos carnosus]